MNALAWALPLAAVVLISPLPAAAADASYSPPSGSLIGTVTDAATGVPLANDCDLTITAHYADGWDYAVKRFTGCLDVAGQYSIAGLPTDRYRVEITDASGAYFDQWLPDPNAPSWYSSRLRSAVLPVTDGAATPANIALIRPGSITGQVTAAATGQPLASDCDVHVEVDWAYGSATGPGYATDCTDANGQFTISPVEPGDYEYTITHPGYVHQFGQFTVPAGQQARADAALVVGARLRVIFRSSLDGSRLGNAHRAVVGVAYPGQPNRWAAGRIATTNRYGVLTVHDIQPGSYVLEIDLQDIYRHRRWRFPGPRPSVSLTSGETTSVTVRLDPGPRLQSTAPPAPKPAPPPPTTSGPTGAISGVIRDVRTGLPLAGYCDLSIHVVTKFPNPSNSAEEGEVAPAKTWTGCLDANGRYRVGGLPVTTGRYSEYTVYVVDDAKRYGSRYFGDTPSPYRAKYVSVAAQRTTTAVDVSLPKLATVSGTLYDAGTGAPLANFCDMSVRVTGADPVSLCTDANGGYTVIGVKSGSYVTVQFTPATDYESHAWMSGETFSLSAGEQLTNVNAYLVPTTG